MAKTDDLQAWRSFIVFARSGTLTAAAKALETEPSSISRAISGLERTLGVELIRHGVRPLVLTDAGRMAHKRMETILRAHDSLMDALKDDNRTKARSVFRRRRVLRQCISRRCSSAFKLSIRV